jgi:PadR family transcriptional regulator AphA
MPKLNRTKQAILGFLTWRPMSGYDIKKAIEGRTSNFWSESYGQIYPILKRLTEEGLVTQSSLTTSGGRDRNVYTITEAGEKELQRWLSEPTESPVLRNELLLKLFFGRQADAEINIRQIETFREAQQQDLERYAKVRQELTTTMENSPDLAYWLMTLRFGETEKQALLTWCDETLAELQQLAKSTNKDTPSQTPNTSKSGARRVRKIDG